MTCKLNCTLNRKRDLDLQFYSVPFPCFLWFSCISRSAPVYASTSDIQSAPMYACTSGLRSAPNYTLQTLGQSQSIHFRHQISPNPYTSNIRSALSINFRHHIHTLQTSDQSQCMYALQASLHTLHISDQPKLMHTVHFKPQITPI